MSYSKDAIMAVTEQIINLLDNNVLHEFNQFECFECWCEDGEVFYNNDDLSDALVEECVDLMHKIAPSVDEMTYNINKEFPEDEI